MVATWPVLDGKYIVGDPEAPVAVCALTSESLVEPLAGVEGVAIAGQVYTANLGIERIVTNVIANPAIRFLLLCGKDSKLFRPGQSLGALADNGTDGDSRIVGAEGYDPVLPNLETPQIDHFRRQVEIVDWTGESDLEALREQIGGLAGRNPGPLAADGAESLLSAPPTVEPARFVAIRPGGRREPLQYDPKGYFVITLDCDEEQVVLRHYLTDHTPAHEMRGRVAESMVLGLLREGLISQLSHAGYLGAELAKAESALHLELRYEQDRPLRRPASPTATAENSAAQAGTPPVPRIAPPLTWEQLRAALEGSQAVAAVEVLQCLPDSELDVGFLEPDSADPFSTYRRTDHRLTVSYAPGIPTVMGELSDVVDGAILRVSGVLEAEGRLAAQRLVILTSVVTVH